MIFDINAYLTNPKNNQSCHYSLPLGLSLKLRKNPKIKYFSSNNRQYSFTSVIPQFLRKYQKIVIVIEKSLHLQHDKWIIVKYRVSYLFMCSFLNTERTQGVFPNCYENLFINLSSHIYIYTSSPMYQRLVKLNWMGTPAILHNSKSISFQLYK